MRIRGAVQEIEKEVFEFLRNSLDDNYEVVSGYNAIPGYCFDIAILRNRVLLAVVEVKLGAIMYGQNPRMFESQYSLLHISGAVYFVVTDGDDYCVFSKESNRPTIIGREDFVRCIVHRYPMAAPEPDREAFAKAIAGSANNSGFRFVAGLLKRRGADLFKCDPKSATISFSLESDEDSFFRKLLPIAKGINHTCRYTSLDSTFKLLKDKRQCMCNILCMNDRSEGIYAEKKVFGTVPDIKESAFSDSDHCYILSLMATSIEDDLTMWRLYGDAAKGACLHYALKEKLANSSKLGEGFFLAKVSYGALENGREVHKELDFLRMIHQYDLGAGWRFKFNRWGIWKHFFKSYHFKDEREIRLLYYDRNDDREPYEWIKNEESQIVTKMQSFSLEDFPLDLQGIIVGPKCMEPKMITRQLQRLAATQNRDMSVSASRIEVYR